MIQKSIYNGLMIKKFYEYYGPVLKYLNENGPTHHSDLKNAIAIQDNLTSEELGLTSEKGTNIFNSRIYWAVQYLFHSGALDRPSKATYAINNFGRELLINNPKEIDPEIIKKTDGYKNWGSDTNSILDDKDKSLTSESDTPTEKIERAIKDLEAALAFELVQRIQDTQPEFLEKIILQLLGRMGYGNGQNAIEHLGGPGDEGLDGVINQDRLGLQRIYIQAKRYATGNNVGRPEIQKFIGALQGNGASGGIFITTSKFSQEAQDFVKRNMITKIILIDGLSLGKLLIEHEVGVSRIRSYYVLEIDENLFDNQNFSY